MLLRSQAVILRYFTKIAPLPRIPHVGAHRSILWSISCGQGQITREFGATGTFNLSLFWIYSYIFRFPEALHDLTYLRFITALQAKGI